MARTQSYLDKAKHAQALLNENADLSPEQISEATGISVTSARRIIRASERGIEINKDVADSATLPVDMQESPQPVGDEPVSEPVTKRGMKYIRSMLGMKDESEKEKEKTQPSSVSLQLNKRQKDFVANFSPVVAYGFILLAKVVWSLPGGEYSELLAPDDKVAQKIMEPLVRIYARHSTFVGAMTPDQIDAGQAIFALLAYVGTSWSMYQRIKADKQEKEEVGLNEYAEENAPYADGYRAESVRQQTDNISRYNGRTNSRQVTNNVEDNGVGVGGSDDGVELTTREQRAQAALSRLSQLDYQSRLRRSGRL